MTVFDRAGPQADFEQVLFCQDGPSGLRAIMAIHSTARGPGFGGIRRRVFVDESAALDEVLGLAHAMSLKCALAELPAGGAKTVILDHPGLDRPAAYRALGQFVDRLGGTYVCGPDVGTHGADLEHVRSATSHVNPAENDAGASTAAGVLAALRGVLIVLNGRGDVAGLTFAVQGLGSVGGSVARTLVAAGARVLGSDPDPAAGQAARQAGVELVRPDAIATVGCDVFMPCALGGVLDADVCGTTGAKAICGSANNQLRGADAAAVLVDRGILHAPDIVVSAGAVIEGVLTVQPGPAGRGAVGAAIAAIEGRTISVLERALATGRSPTDVAFERARAGLRHPMTEP